MLRTCWRIVDDRFDLKVGVIVGGKSLVRGDLSFIKN